MEYDVTRDIRQLEENINHANASERLKMQPKVQKMVDSIMARGQKVPLSLSRINADLADEAFDDMFDNMPL